MKYLVIQGFEKLEGINNYKLNLLPFPQELGEITGFYKLGEELGVFFEDVAPESEEVIIEVMTEELSTIGKLSCKKIKGILPQELKSFEPSNQKVIDETYALYYQEGLLVIMAFADKGIYYGALTFLQLIKLTDDGFVVPELEIFDYPAYEIRCITDQTSRNQIPTVENMKNVVKFLSKFKINYHFFYMEDSFNFKKYPDIGKTRGGYTAEEIKEIQEHAKRYFIEIIPIFNSFGHVDNIIMTNYPKYAHLGEFPGAGTYDVGNPEVKSFVEDLNKELCSAFDSKYFHLGLDETFDFGKYNTKQIIKEKGKDKVMLDFYEFLIDSVKKLGKDKIFCYHDNVLGEKYLLENLPKDLIIFYWDYWLKTWFIFPKKKYKKAKKLRDRGFPVILSPTLYDHTRNFPDTKRTIENVVTMAQYGLEIESLGIATSVWGDFLNENLRENNYFGYLVTAEAAWSPEKWDDARFKENFAWFFYGLDNLEIIRAIENLNAYNDHHSMYPLKFFCHIWRHPFPGKKIKPKVKKLNDILQKSEEALQILGKLKLKVKRNEDNLDYLAYAAKLGIYLGKKYQISIEVQKKLNKGKEFYNSAELIERITYLKDYIEALKKDYEELWLRFAKPNGLELILENFDAAIFFYEQKIQEIKDGITWKNPFLKAEFITARKKVKMGNPVFLRKKFSIKKPIKRCHIQGMCDMLMHLYLNGEKLGEIVSKMSLAVEPIKQRIQLFVVTDKINEGNNVIGAECHNYLISRVAGNIYLEIEYETGEKEIIITNSDWKANHVLESNWLNLEFDDSHWKNAKSLGAPPTISGHVTQPHISAGIKSQDSCFYGIDTFVKGIIPWVPLFLGPLAKKIVGLDIF
ncbi:MAG: family 20 glycosylhydrolase [Candidatus Helarchaeota archaeon]|nr:family 20 glycosylhydrolase [Candidatus Helarchaeota archaeon]